MPRNLPAGFWALLLLTAAVRLPGIDRPLLGHFATKNVTYAMIARNWAAGRASIWYPTVDCMASGERGWHLLELPVAAYVAGTGWKCFGGSLDVWGRGTSIAFTVAAVGLLWLLVRRWHGTSAAWAAGLLLALSPVAIVFGQSFMLESSLVFFSVCALWCLDAWFERGRAIWLVAAAASLALLLLTKIYMLVFLMPLTALVLRPTCATLRRITKTSAADRRVQQFTLAAVLSVLPAGIWYANAWRAADPEHPASEQVYYSVRQSTAAHRVPNPLLASASFYGKLLGDLAGPVLTPLGFVLLVVGLWPSESRRHGVWLAAMLLLVAVLPKKFVELTYYHMAILPLWCVLAGVGWRSIEQRFHPGRWAIAGLLFAAGALALRYAYAPAFITPSEDRGVLAAAEAARGLAHADEPIVTLHGAAPDLLYYCDRAGWVLSTNDPRLADKLEWGRRAGARWLVVADLDSLATRASAVAALSGFRVVQAGDDYRIYDLSRRDVAATRP